MLDETLAIEKRHQEICDDIHSLYIRKNAAYGDSFHKLYEDLGIISAVTQITHKYNRLKNLAKEMQAGHLVKTDESIQDTLLDMANYCILTALEIERSNNESLTVLEPEKDNNKSPENK